METDVSAELIVVKIEEPEQPPAIEDQIDDFGLKY